MAQVTIPNGEAMGAPGPIGSPVVYCFADIGDPNLRADPLSLMANCALGSQYLRVDPPDATHGFYIKTGVATAAAPTGTWTGK
jgi:hypothetical protein